MCGRAVVRGTRRAQFGRVSFSSATRRVDRQAQLDGDTMQTLVARPQLRAGRQSHGASRWVSICPMPRPNSVFRPIKCITPVSVATIACGRSDNAFRMIHAAQGEFSDDEGMGEDHS